MSSSTTLDSKFSMRLTRADRAALSDLAKQARVTPSSLMRRLLRNAVEVDRTNCLGRVRVGRLLRRSDVSAFTANPR